MAAGMGLLAGAAIGGKRRKENQLLLVVRYMRTECYIVLSPSKKTPAIYSEFKKLMRKQTKVNNPIVYSEPENENNNQVDLASELEKIYSLYQKGILTQEEFEAQKKKMLS